MDSAVDKPIVGVDGETSVIIERVEKDGIQIIALDGMLDTSQATQFEAYLEGLMAEGSTRIVIDLKKLAFITSSGLRVLLATGKRLKAIEGELCVADLNRTVQEVFDISGFSSLLRVFATVDEALGEI